MTLLRVDKPEGETVTVRNEFTGEDIEARVDDDGVVREQNGPAPYSNGMYQVVEDA